MSPPWIERVVQRIEPEAGLGDCGLPEPVVSALGRIAERVRTVSTGPKTHADVTAIFEGGGSPDRRLAAGALAQDLGLDVYRIDLSLVVADEVIETERTLRRILDAAEQAGGVLLFDEAEAMIRPGPPEDPYPEAGAGYLLKQMGRYEGLSILSISDRSVLDPSLARRVRFTVSFQS